MTKAMCKEAVLRLLRRGMYFEARVIADDMGWSDKYFTELQLIVAVEKIPSNK